MVNSNRLFCRLDGLSPIVREQQRVAALESLELLETEIIPVFDEATQTAASFLEAPICILGLMVQEQLWLKSAVGLSRLGFMNRLTTSRKLPRQDSFCTYVVDSQQSLAIEDTLNNPIFACSGLVQHYGVRAYLGTPLIASSGHCIGALAVMDLVSRQFTARDAEFLALTARWCLSEFERNRLLQAEQTQGSQLLELIAPSLPQSLPTAQNDPSAWTSTSEIKVKLLEQITEKLRTPLTSVIGMASVLQRGVYGSVTGKQKEYLAVIYDSGQQMLSLMEEIVNLGGLSENASKVELNPVDLEMLCQQVLNDLAQIAKQRQQELHLSIEPGNRIWVLDKEKVRHALYYLMTSIIESSTEGAQVRVHVSRKSKCLLITVWVTHPWLGNGLPQVSFVSGAIARSSSSSPNSSPSSTTAHSLNRTSKPSLAHGQQPRELHAEDDSGERLGLLLSCHLIELHGGTITVQGTPESGHRYTIQLPKIAGEEK